MAKVRIYQKPAGIPANTSVFAVEILQNNVWYTRKVSWETIKGLIAGAESLVFDDGTLTFTTPDGIAHQVLSVDSEVIPNSANPVSGGAVNTALAGKQDTLTFDQTPTDGSTNPVESNGIYDALALKQDTLTFDQTPTDGSTNPVMSQGIYAAISAAISGLDWKEAVATYADIATTYPNPEDGWTVTTLDDDHTYRYNGTEWVDQFSLITLATSTKDGLMSSADFAKLAGIEAGANNTTDDDITDVVVDLTDMQQTASANPITLETKQAGLAKSCVVEMNPIQDLHGYDHPWAGGAGKNKFQTTAISSGNFTVNLDGTVTVNGSFSGTSQFTVGTFDFKANTQYKLVGCPNGGGGSSYALYARGAEGFNQQVDQGNGVTFTPETDITTEIRVIIYSGYTASNVLFKPMISTDTSVTYATFAPYSNICPISGRTEASVTRTGKNVFNLEKYLTDNNITYTKDGEWFIFSIGSALYANKYTLPELGYYSGQLIIDSSRTVATNVNLRTYKNGSAVAQGATFTNQQIDQVGFNYSTTGQVCCKVQAEYGASNTTYEPYTAETKTHQYSDTIYGGEDDFVNGGLTNEWVLAEYDGTENWLKASSATWDVFYVELADKATGLVADIRSDSTDISIYSFAQMVEKAPCISIRTNVTPNRLHIAIPNATKVDECKAYLAEHNLQVCYKKATPTTIQLSPEALTLLKGLNVISTDGDKVQVEFSDIPVGDYSALLDYVKSLEARIQTLEGGN